MQKVIVSKSFLLFLFLLLSVGNSPIALARTITSSLRLKFFEIGTEGKPDRYVGATPAKSGQSGARVPASDRWYVCPIGTYTESDRKKLALELQRARVPGLDLSDRWDFTDASLEGLRGLTQLRVLYLARTRISDAGLAHVGSLSGLVHLSLPRQTSDAGLGRLQALKQLRRLELPASKVTDAGLSALQNLPQLERLDLSGSKITDAGVQALVGIRTLRELDISDTAITDKGAVLLTQLQQLRTLYLPAGVTNKTLAHLADLKTLESLDVSGSQVTDAGMALIAVYPRLRELAVSGTQVTNQALPILQSMPALQTLEVSDTAVTGEGFVGLRGFHRLETLGVSWKELTPLEIQALGERPRLKEVVLNGWTVTEEALQQIRALAKLQKSPDVPKKDAVQASARPRAPDAHQADNRFLVPARLEERRRSQPPQGLDKDSVTKRPALPADVEPSALKRPVIGTSGPAGKSLGEIVVSARPATRERRVTGLKRLRQHEFSQTPRELELEPGSSPQIRSRQDPANSLGEIQVNSQP